jgi:CBS domain containing-hemolysin-like protein
MDDPLIWSIIVILVVFGAFFSATETALAAANRIKLKVAADDGDFGAKLAVKYIEKFEKSVITTVIGSNVVSVFISSLATLMFTRLLGQGLGSTIATLVATAIFYLFCDTIPKSMARALPNQVAVVSSYLLQVFMVIFFPIIKVFEGLDFLVKKIFKAPAEPELTNEDFSDIIEAAEEKGTLAEEDSELIQSALDFSETAVKDVFTPLNQIVGVNLKELTQESLHAQLLETTFSRLPVYEDAVDNIVGILHVRTYFKQLRHHPKLNVKDVISKPYFVSTQILIDDLFDGFRKYKTHIAIVTNAKGRVVGMVTMEDVLEEIVGQINEIAPKRRKPDHVG